MARPSMRRAIDRFCRWCIVDPKAVGQGTWRQQTEACASKECPLWPLRPKSRGEGVTDDPETGPDAAQEDTE